MIIADLQKIAGPAGPGLLPLAIDVPLLPAGAQHTENECAAKPHRHECLCHPEEA